MKRQEAQEQSNGCKKLAKLLCLYVRDPLRRPCHAKIAHRLALGINPLADAMHKLANALSRVLLVSKHEYSLRPVAQS